MRPEIFDELIISVQEGAKLLKMASNLKPKPNPAKMNPAKVNPSDTNVPVPPTFNPKSPGTSKGKPAKSGKAAGKMPANC